VPIGPYRGLDVDELGAWHQGEGPTVFATFDSDTDYFGSRSQQVVDEDMDGVGRFGWVTDPEGNRIELWQATAR
jgi:hypothetical protein